MAGGGHLNSIIAHLVTKSSYLTLLLVPICLIFLLWLHYMFLILTSFRAPASFWEFSTFYNLFLHERKALVHLSRALFIHKQTNKQCQQHNQTNQFDFPFKLHIGYSQVFFL